MYPSSLLCRNISVLFRHFCYSIDLTPLVKAYMSGREPDYVTSVLDCATGLQYRAVDAVVGVLVEGLDKRATLVTVKPFAEQCVSRNCRRLRCMLYVHVCVCVQSCHCTCFCVL